MKLFNLIKYRTKLFFILMKEGATATDKIIILDYHLQAPIQLFNYLRGKVNSRKLGAGVYIKNNFGEFYCGNDFSCLVGCSSICEEDIRDLTESIMDRKKGNFLDIGANVGMYSVPVARELGKRGKVYSFEIEKKNRDILKKNIVLNNLKNVVVFDKGVSSKKGKADLYLDPHGSGSHSLIKTPEHKKIKVDVDTIDNMLKKHNVDKVSLIKIDVEGAELEALKGAKNILKKSHADIIFESITEKELSQTMRLLRGYGYNHFFKLGEVNYFGAKT